MSDSHSKTKPINPSEAQALKDKNIPDGVIEVFNEMLVEKLSEGTATLNQGELVSRIMAKMGCERQTIFDNHWLDVEGIFQREGWSVEYDKPAWDENYEAHFKFRPKR